MPDRTEPTPTPPALPGEAVEVAAKQLEAAFKAVGGMTTTGYVTWEELARHALEAARPHLAAAERARPASGAACITPCDDDCELQPDGCHEEHTPDFGRKRGHQPWACQDIRAAIAAAVAAEREAAEARHMEYLSKLTREYDANLRASVAAAAHEALCWEQPADGRLIACDRMKDHKGGHSWEAADAVAAERERIASLANQWGATYAAANEPGHTSAPIGFLPFADLLRQDGGT